MAFACSSWLMMGTGVCSCNVELIIASTSWIPFSKNCFPSVQQNPAHELQYSRAQPSACNPHWEKVVRSGLWGALTFTCTLTKGGEIHRLVLCIKNFSYEKCYVSAPFLWNKPCINIHKHYSSYLINLTIWHKGNIPYLSSKIGLILDDITTVEISWISPLLIVLVFAPLYRSITMLLNPDLVSGSSTTSGMLAVEHSWATLQALFS